MSRRISWGAGVVIGCCLALQSPIVAQVPGPKPIQHRIDNLVKGLKSPDHSVRQNAATTLGKLGSAATPAVPALIKAIKDNDNKVSIAAAEALGQMGSAATSAIPALIAYLNDTDGDIRVVAAEALGQMRSAAAPAVPALIQALKDKSYGVRMYASIALGKVGPAAALATPALTQALKDSDSRVRPLAATALGQIGSAASSAIPALIEALRDRNNESQLRRFAALALGQMGSAAVSAVPALAEALRDNDDNVRIVVARALGKMGSSAASAVPALIVVIKEIDGKTQSPATQSLGAIATSVAKEIQRMHYPELNQAISFWRNAQASLDTMPNKTASDSAASNEARDAVYRLVNVLQREKLARERAATPALLRAHPWVTGITVYLILIFLLCLVLWLNWPYTLFIVNEKLKSWPEVKLPAQYGGAQVGMRHLLGFGFLHYHPRVLDAWVKTYAPTVEKQLRAKDTFKQRAVCVELPALWNRENTTITPALLQPLFAKKSGAVLLWGEGGSGKTTLVCQMTLWALSANRSGRLCETHQMLPVFIEENIASDDAKGSALLLTAIQNRLKLLTGEDDVPALDLVRNLLRRRRLLVVVDGLSELNEATRSLFLTDSAALPMNALIVTSRTEEKFATTNPATIKTALMQWKQVAAFLEDYLIQCGKRGLFTDDKLSAEQSKFHQLVGTHEITALLAQLYAQYLIDAKEKADTERPCNVPELMDTYVNELCGKVDIAPYEQRDIHEMAQIVAWESVRTTFTPAEVRTEEVEKALAALCEEDRPRPYLSDPRAAIVFMVTRLHLLQERGLNKDRLKFALDPPSEYLAARHLVGACYGESIAAWKGFFAEVQAKSNAPQSIVGFLRAVYDTWNAFGPNGITKNYVLTMLYEKFEDKSGIPPPEPRNQGLSLWISLLESGQKAACLLAIEGLEALGEAACPAISALQTTYLYSDADVQQRSEQLLRRLGVSTSEVVKPGVAA